MKRGIKGEISAFPLTDILQWIEASRKTGVLLVNGEALNACLCFEEGKLLMASARQRTLAEALNASMGIPADLMSSSLKRSRDEGMPLMKLLIDNLYITEDALQSVLQQTAETMVVDILCMHGGAFEFIEELPAYMKGSPVKLPTGFLVFECVRRYDEIKRTR